MVYLENHDPVSGKVKIYFQFIFAIWNLKRFTIKGKPGYSRASGLKYLPKRIRWLFGVFIFP
jgi:hypothetical protein